MNISRLLSMMAQAKKSVVVEMDSKEMFLSMTEFVPMDRPMTIQLMEQGWRGEVSPLFPRSRAMFSTNSVCEPCYDMRWLVCGLEGRGESNSQWPSAKISRKTSRTERSMFSLTELILLSISCLEERTVLCAEIGWHQHVGRAIVVALRISIIDFQARSLPEYLFIDLVCSGHSLLRFNSELSVENLGLVIEVS